MAWLKVTARVRPSTSGLAMVGLRLRLGLGLRFRLALKLGSGFWLILGLELGYS